MVMLSISLSVEESEPTASVTGISHKSRALEVKVFSFRRVHENALRVGVCVTALLRDIINIFRLVLIIEISDGEIFIRDLDVIFLGGKKRAGRAG